ncbi:MAG: NosD domain-containing protein [Candidatus Bathyarchaeia archaeon]
MSKGKVKKSWKERLRERQIKYQRILESHRARVERRIVEQKSKIRKRLRIIMPLCLFAIILVVIYSAGHYSKPPAMSNTGQETNQNTQGEFTSFSPYIYIWPDGRIEPSNAPLLMVNNSYYKFTGNASLPIIVLKDNITIDGAGYYVVGTQTYGSRGIDISYRKNVTVVNIKVVGFDYAIYMDQTSNSNVFESEFTSNYCGVWISRSSFINISSNRIYENRGYALWMKNSTNNIISWNTITRHSNYTIYIGYSSNNTIKHNTIANNRLGLFLYSSTCNIIACNNITKNYEGVHLLYSSENQITFNDIVDNDVGIGSSESRNNKVYYNNFINNVVCVNVQSSTDIWDDGVSRGNYWSDYLDKNPNAERLNEVWNAPYVINESNQDNYPLTAPIKTKIV